MSGECLSKTKTHFVYYKNIYIFLLVLALIVGICSIFIVPITNGVVDAMEKIGVDTSNPGHALAFICCYIVLFLPHPFGLQWLVTAIAGFYFGWWFLLICGAGQLVGVPPAYLIAKNLNHCTKYLIKEEDLDDFKEAFNAKPILMTFLIMFGPAPAQYQILIPTWLDVHWSIIFFFCALGNWMILVPYGAVGAQATNIQDAVNSDNPVSKLIVPCLLIFGIICVLVVGYEMNKILEENKHGSEDPERQQSAVKLNSGGGRNTASELKKHVALE